MYPVTLDGPCTPLWAHVAHPFTILTPSGHTVTVVCPGHVVPS